MELTAEADEVAFAKALDTWVEAVDYHLLNQLSALAGRNPTAEALAELAFRHLQDAALRPRSVKIREKANYWALCRDVETQ